MNIGFRKGDIVRNYFMFDIECIVLIDPVKTVSEMNHVHKIVILYLCKSHLNTSLSVCQVARATGEAKCHGSKLHKEVTEIKVYWFVCLNTFKFAKVYWFVCLNTFKFAKSKNGLFET